MKTSANVLKMMAIALLSTLCLTSCQPTTPSGDSTKDLSGSGEQTSKSDELTSKSDELTSKSDELTSKSDELTTDSGKDPGENPKPLTGLRKVLHNQMDEETTAFLNNIAKKDEQVKKLLEDENYLVMEIYVGREFNGRETVSHFESRIRGISRSFAIFNATDVYTLTCHAEKVTLTQKPIAQNLYLKKLLQEDGEISYQGKTSPIKSITRLGEAIYVETEKENYIRLLNVPKYPVEECYAFSGDMMPLQTYRLLYGKYQEEDLLFSAPGNRIYDAVVRAYVQNTLTNLHPIATGALQLPEDGMELTALYKKLFGDLESSLIPAAQISNVYFLADGTRRIAVTFSDTGEGENSKRIVKKVLWDRTGEQFVTDADMEKITTGTKVEDLATTLGCPYYISINRIYVDYCTKDGTAYRVYFNQKSGKEGLVESVRKCKLWGNADKPLDVSIRDILKGQLDADTKAFLNDKLYNFKAVRTMIDQNAYVLEFYPDVIYTEGDTAATLKEKISAATKTKRAFYIFDENNFYEIVIENGNASVTDKGKLHEKREWLLSLTAHNGVYTIETEEYVTKKLIALKNAVYFETDQGILVRPLAANGAFEPLSPDHLVKGTK